MCWKLASCWRKGEVLDYEVGVGAEGGAQRSKEAEKQGTHRVIMHDGEPHQPKPDAHRRHRRKTHAADGVLASDTIVWWRKQNKLLWLRRPEDEVPVLRRGNPGCRDLVPVLRRDAERGTLATARRRRKVHLCPAKGCD